MGATSALDEAKFDIRLMVIGKKKWVKERTCAGRVIFRNGSSGNVRSDADVKGSSYA